MLELKFSDGSKVLNKGINRRSGQNRLTSVAVAVMVVMIAGLLSPTFAQQESTDADTSYRNVSIEIPFYENDFQGFSPELKSVHFNAFGDFSVQQALIRFPGIQVNRDGEINIRGVGYDAYRVSLNGMRLANNGLGNRSFDLASISTDGLTSIEVQKVVDPSMDAEALAGYINLKTERPASGTRHLNIAAGGGVNTGYLNRGGPSSRASIHYFEQYSDQFSLDVNLNYLQDQFTREELLLGFNSMPFTNGSNTELYDVVNQISPSSMNDERQRYSISTTARFTPDESAEYFFQLFVNNQNREKVKHQNSSRTNGDWLDPTTTGAQGELGTYAHEASHDNKDLSQVALQAGGSNEMDNLTINYDAGWSQSRSNNSDYLFSFMVDELDYELDLSDRNYPQLAITNLNLLSDGSVNRQDLRGNEFNRITEDHINDEFNARFDVELPVSVGALKAGASVRYSVKEGEFDDYRFNRYNNLDLSSRLQMMNFLMLKEPIRNIDVVNDEYFMPWFLNTDYAIEFLENQRPLFDEDPTQHAYNSGIYNYENAEQIYAAYVMGDLDFGMLKVKGGIRIEQTLKELDGNSVFFDENGDYTGTDLNSESADDFQLFPNLQLQLIPMEQNRVHVAYSRTIQRPDYYLQTPFLRIDSSNTSIYSGNSELTPVTSDNFDLIIERKISNSGIVSVGGFYKSIFDLIVQKSSIISSKNHIYTRFDRPEPLALLMLEAARQGREEVVPPFVTGYGSTDGEPALGGRPSDEYFYRETYE